MLYTERVEFILQQLQLGVIVLYGIGRKLCICRRGRSFFSRTHWQCSPDLAGNMESIGTVRKPRRPGKTGFINETGGDPKAPSAVIVRYILLPDGYGHRKSCGQRQAASVRSFLTVSAMGRRETGYFTSRHACPA